MASTKMEMTEEFMNDTLDDITADSDDEAERMRFVSQVLDEIGIEISGKMICPVSCQGHGAERSGYQTRTQRQMTRSRKCLRAQIIG